MSRRRDDGTRLADWLDRHEVGSIRVVSPHLDDAAFSLARFLSLPSLPPRTVYTVFTEAGSRTQEAHARAMGFTSAAEEFEARRREDHAAMARLGVPYVHCGIESGARDDATAETMAGKVLGAADARSCLLLLPVGAGRHLGPAGRLVRRVLRIPSGSGKHGEHLWTRDALRHRAKNAGLQVGYYAEVPYQWANSRRALATLATSLLGGTPDIFELAPDPSHKLAAASDYASQVVSEFGESPSWQRKTAAIPERIYLPAG